MSLLDNDVFIREYLKVAEEQFKNGNRAVLLMALNECFLLRKAVPEWLRLALLAAYESATAFEIRSWDEAFGAPHAKGAHLEALKKQSELRFVILSRVQARAASGDTIDKELFEKIGRELGVSGSVASTIYYDARSKTLRELKKILDGNNSEKN